MANAWPLAARIKRRRIWNVETGHCDQVLTGHTRQVYDLAISPDGQRIVTASFDGTARIWSTESGVMELELRDAFEENTIGCGPPPGARTGRDRHGKLRRHHSILDGEWRSAKQSRSAGGATQSLDFDRGWRSPCLPIPWRDGLPPCWISNRTESWRVSTVISRPFQGKLSPDGTLAARPATTAKSSPVERRQRRTG